MTEPAREQLAAVYRAAGKLIKEKQAQGKAPQADKWEIVGQMLGMDHLTVDACMRALADKGVFTLRKTVNHIPILIQK